MIRKNKKADLGFTKIVMILIMIILVIWVFFWYSGMRGDMTAMIDVMFG